MIDRHYLANAQKLINICIRKHNSTSQLMDYLEAMFMEEYYENLMYENEEINEKTVANVEISEENI